MKNAELKKKFRNKYVIRIIAGAVSIAVIGTGAGAYTVHAQKTETAAEQPEEKNTDKKEKTKAAEKELLSALSQDSEENEKADKEETVYVVAKADGTADDVIVSEWLKNKEGSDTIKDVSDLKDIENVKGDETFSRNGNELTWNAKGNDIYYQGTTDKKLPVTEKVTYYLDGKEMEPEKIAGKSGKVTIRFDYTNHEKTTQTVDGKKYQVYTPFTVMTGMILPEDYSNVEVTNGKIISDGSKKVVVGIAMPGMKESLDLEEKDLKDLEIPEYVEVTADVENFSLDMTMSVMMNDLLGEADLDKAFDLSELEDSINTLSDSSKQLTEGSTDLAEGLKTLKSSMQEFISGADTLKNGIGSYTSGATQLNNGLNTLNEGVSTLAEGAGTLSNGVNTISQSFSGEEGLVKGAKAIKDGVNELDKSLKTAMTEEEKAAVAQQADAAVESTFQNGASKQISDQAAKQFSDTMTSSETVTMIYQGLRYGADGSDGELYTSLYNAACGQKLQEIMAAQGCDQAAAQQIFAGAGGPAQVQGAVEGKLKTLASAVAGGIAENGKAAMGSSVAEACKTAAKTAAESAAVTGAEGAKTQIASKIEDGGLVKGAQSLSAGVDKLYKEGIQPLQSGVGAMTAKIPELTSGVGELVKGSSELVANNSALTEGAGKLSAAASLLGEGAGKLESGSNELMEGMVKFDQEGIQKLADAYHGDAKELLNKLTAVVNAGKDYQTFTQAAEGARGTVKFILRTEAVKAEEK